MFVPHPRAGLGYDDRFSGFRGLILPMAFPLDFFLLPTQGASGGLTTCHPPH